MATFANSDSIITKNDLASAAGLIYDTSLDIRLDAVRNTAIQKLGNISNRPVISGTKKNVYMILPNGKNPISIENPLDVVGYTGIDSVKYWAVGASSNNVPAQTYSDVGRQVREVDSFEWIVYPRIAWPVNMGNNRNSVVVLKAEHDWNDGETGIIRTYVINTAIMHFTANPEQRGRLNIALERLSDDLREFLK